MRRYHALAMMLLLLGPAAAHGDNAPGDDASGDGAPTVPPLPKAATLMHVPPVQAVANRPLRLIAAVDAAWTTSVLVVRYRPISDHPAGSHNGPYAEEYFERSSAGGHYATIPAHVLQRPGIEYYLVSESVAGGRTAHFASADTPHRVLITPSSTTLRRRAELDRLDGLLSSVSIDVQGHVFDNRYGTDDRFMRGELTWTHHLLYALHAVSMGYGFVEGNVPIDLGPEAQARRQGAHYGFGGVRMRVHPSIWLDARALIGVDREGFVAGAGGAITLGKPWRANLSMGGEYLQTLGYEAWIRLQWDTVPPFLMGATLVRTQLPGATEIGGGAYIVYDVSYPLTSRIAVRGKLSLGSREGPSSFGGGVGSEFRF